MPHRSLFASCLVLAVITGCGESPQRGASIAQLSRGLTTRNGSSLNGSGLNGAGLLGGGVGGSHAGGGAVLEAVALSGPRLGLDVLTDVTLEATVFTGMGPSGVLSGEQFQDVTFTGTISGGAP